MKGVSSLLSFVLLVLIVMVSIAIVLNSSKSTIDTAINTVDLKDAENVMTTLQNAIAEVESEGNGSSRVISFLTKGKFRVIAEEDAVQFSDKTSGFEYLSRVARGNMIYIAGNDVSCGIADANNDGTNDLVMENSFLKAAFSYTPRMENLSAINTTKSILLLSEKTRNTIVRISNSSVVIDGNLSTASGTGYSEILKQGNELPVCTVHFYVNSTVAYDVFYKLYAGADFIVTEVRLRE